jgi:hypothetical protein
MTPQQLGQMSSRCAAGKHHRQFKNCNLAAPALCPMTALSGVSDCQACRKGCEV